ncbi:MAG: diguanylate cyclase [Phycisphaerales bacterium]|nr:diguanylate cyclase [Phycisphaerales bacterium]
MDSQLDMRDRALPQVLIVESDPGVAAVLAQAIASDRTPLTGSETTPRYHIIDSIAHLHRLDLRCFGAALVASVMQDGCGLDVLAYLRGLAPNLPVVMIGGLADSSIAGEAIRAGASEFVLLTGHEAVTIPLAVRKAIVHRQLRQDNEVLQQTLTRSMGELAEVNRRLESSISRLESMARTDDLTGLTNRRWMNFVLEDRWVESDRHGLELGFLMIDLDGFKQLNDTLGHPRGDEILRRVADVLRETVREIDVAARYGGDEFCVMLPHADLAATIAVAKRLADQFELARADWSLGDVELGMSIGVAHRGHSGAASPDELIRHADEAMYAAKKSDRTLMLRNVTPGNWSLVA